MYNLTSSQLACIIQGTLFSGAGDCVLGGTVGTDSRVVEKGMIFFALSGEKFDGNAFASEAASRGASAVVVSRPVEVDSSDCAVIVVEDTLVALQQLAGWWRDCLSSLVVVGVTGSSGKTSTKDLTLGVLSQAFRVTATKGNFNNHIGVPLSILKGSPQDTAAIWEMGMNHAGELSPLCAMTRPFVGLISSIGSAHIEFLGSRDAIAEEKCTLARSLPEDGAMIYPADCDYARLIRSSTKARCIAVGIGMGDVRAENVSFDEHGSRYTLVIDGFCRREVRLNVHGRHMVSNSLLAAATGWFLGMEADAIARGLAEASLTGGRLRCFVDRGVLVVDDTYNANPESMVAALDTLSMMNGVKGRRWAVLGRMGELGDFADEAHRRVGEHAAQCGLDALVCVGPEMSGMAEAARDMPVSVQFDTREAAAAWLKDQILPGDTVLFKGSRSSSMELVMNQIFSDQP
ncbi:UDP-N-acetylmuramoyl-tripeptide--D-alanyl-D-alanine ligase [Akkermansia sp. N21169]|jgi:UDP-N-acetylmuramoyl-tripeptide--D-alanyl-D-alanine ligase|uniref:UDP-N-acetylmuramoyl-tripeptide--D-alanyl-D- alanine ligase n=1 Tax=unclassified Akkermansia TaxID=2608915 RepID=UPI00244E88D0|nr:MULTISPECIES: UDP-N-acetylmuramoyl-tripeptide--D-alanyl-D-alanine ligase [unclassified Akkermansia]MDH3069869.1 UDP-N-acetylmuramoyl-tripeptide--D-alanyl-D-alanine ligase [Akkermansia sp. N21169]WPX40376.1 UDP-N-acetylmuramoyl-tripeptide--D-alanyl-D-alanine ligase [Akkermansia sp. N21116]